MADNTATRYSLIRATFAIALVFLLVQSVESGDVLSDATRPVITGIFRMLGAEALDDGGVMHIGKLEVPWTPDCSGLNILAILMALALWMNRHEPSLWRYGLLALLAAPVSFVANLLRILTLVGFRWLFYPEVESPSLHYFIGFVWLMPAIPLVVPLRDRQPVSYVMEMLYWAVALSFLAPFVGSHGGQTVGIATLALLAGNRTSHLPRRLFWLFFGIWALAGVYLVLTRMESLRLIWLLTCPTFASRRTLLSLPGLVLLIGTVQLVAMMSAAPWVVLAALGAYVWSWLKTERPEAIAPPHNPTRCLATTAMLLLPFLAPLVTFGPRETIAPPAGIMVEPIQKSAYRLRLVGQSPAIDVAWYGPYGHGRHHTLQVCMQFRGVHITPEPGQSGVEQTDLLWLREFFMVNNRMLYSYQGYLLHTFLPFSSTGVHIIMSAPKTVLSAKEFDRETLALARRIEALAAGQRTSSR